MWCEWHSQSYTYIEYKYKKVWYIFLDNMYQHVSVLKTDNKSLLEIMLENGP